MAWWRINSVEEGGIDTSFHPDGGLQNAALPMDHPEQYYNGDDVADVLGEAIKKIKTMHGVLPPKKLVAQMFFAWPLICSDSYWLHMTKVAQDAKEIIRGLYRTQWGREPFAEELQAAFNFAFHRLYEPLL